MNGILLVDKPSGPTSHDVVNHIRRAANMRRVGHTGTLDPAATGLLVLCLGLATRLSEHLTRLDKVYEGKMQFGIVTDTHDLDGTVLEEHTPPQFEASDIEAVFSRFVGNIMQTPPMVSAVKVGGQRLYKMARRGETIERKPRPVTVREFHLKSYEPPHACFRVRCTSGTYVRTLCHEVGQALGCGAALAALRRTWVGPHCVDKAKPLDYFTDEERVASCLEPMADALEMPAATLKRTSLRAVRSGDMLALCDLKTECPVSEGWVQLKTPDGRLAALAMVSASPMGVRIHPKRVFLESRA